VKAVPSFVLCVPPAETVTEFGGPMNLALTFGVPLTVKEHVDPDPVQAPVQPTNVHPGAGLSLRMTVDPSRNAPEAEVQLRPQEIAAGVDVIVPPCAPFFVIVSVSAVPIVSVSPAELFDGFESVIVPGTPTVALLTIVPVAAGATFAVIV
jgi:hypothetical protein